MRRTIPLGFLIAILTTSAAHAVFEPAPTVERDGRFGSGSDDFAGDIAFDALGNSYHMVSTDGTFPGETSSGGRDVVMRKNDPAGNELWTTQIGSNGTDNYGRTMAVTPTGISAIVGNTTAAFPGFTFLGGFYDAFVAIFDVDGNQVVVDQFGTSSWDEAYGVYTDGTRFWVTGFTDGTFAGETSAGGRDGFVRVYGLDGTLLDSTQFGTSGSDNPTDVAADGSGNVYVTGFTGGAFSPSIGLNDGFVVKLDPALDFVAGTNHGTNANDNYKAIDVGAGGDVVVVGATFGAIAGQTASGWDIVVEGIDPATTSSLWIRQFGLTSNYDSGEDVAVAADGTSYTAGNTYGIEGLGTVANPHGFVVVLDGNGSDLWGDQFTAVGATLDIYGAGLDPAGRAWLAGYTRGTFGGPAAGGYDAIYRGYQPFAGNVTDITACGFVAEAPGDYRLAGDVAGGGPCIDVTSAGVTLDLNGFRITVQDGGTGLPGTGIRVGAGLDTQIVNQGTSSAEIVVESAGGVGVDLSGSSGATLDGGTQRTDILLDAVGGTKTAVVLSDSVGSTVRDVQINDSSADGTGVILDRSFSASLTDVRSIHEASLAVQLACGGFDISDALMADTQVTGGNIDLAGTGFQIDRLEAVYNDADGYTRIAGSGAVTDYVQSGGGAIFDGRDGNVLRFDSPEIRGFRADVEFGDDVSFRNGLMAREDPSAVVLLSGPNGTTEFESLVIGKRVSDRVGLLVDVAPGASADLTVDFTVDTLDDATGTSTVGSQLYVQDRLTVGPLSANVGFRNDHVADSPGVLAQGATEVHFRTYSLATGDKQTYRDGVLEPACVPQADGYTVLCPENPADSKYVFAHQTSTGCGTYTTDDVVVYQDVTFDVAAGTVCVDLQARLTWECDGNGLQLPAGSPGSETVGFRIGASGNTVENCGLGLEGADTVGVDVDPGADDTTLRNLKYAYDGIGGRGVRARAVDHLSLDDDTHTASGPAGARYAYDLEDVTALRVQRSVAEDPALRHAYDVRARSVSGEVSDSRWTGSVDLLGRDAIGRLVFRDGVWDARGTDRAILLGDDVEARRVRVYAPDGTPIENTSLARGPVLEDVEIFASDGRSVALLQDNPASEAQFRERLRLRTFRDHLRGSTDLPLPPSGTAETGITQRWSYDDRDSAAVGDEFSLEPTVDLTFEQMATPADTTAAALHLQNAGQDAIANGGCSIVSVAPDPVKLTCDRDFGTGGVQAETVHYVYCGDGVANAEVEGDDCDPPGSGKCQAGCTLPPPSDLIDHRIEVSDTDPDDLILTWNDSGEGPYEIYRSTDPANVETIPANKIGLTSGTTWTDTPPAGQSYYYRVVPAP